MLVWTLSLPDVTSHQLAIVIHVGMNDIPREQSELWKADFVNLFTVSGPIPVDECGSGRFSRLLSLHTWLSSFVKNKVLSIVTILTCFGNLTILCQKWFSPKYARIYRLHHIPSSNNIWSPLKPTLAAVHSTHTSVFMCHNSTPAASTVHTFMNSDVHSLLTMIPVIISDRWMRNDIVWGVKGSERAARGDGPRRAG